MEDYGEASALALILGGNLSWIAPISEAAQAAEWQVVELGTVFAWPDDAQAARPADLILCDIRSDTETPEREIVRAAQYALQHDLPLLAWTDMQRLDEVDMLLRGLDRQILVDPQPVELAIALTSARSRRRGSSAREERGESPELLRLSQELIDMARRLARIQDGPGSGSVRADPLNYRGAPPSAAKGLGNRGLDEEAAEPLRSEQVREIIRLRRMRETMFAADLFADPAWDMLLDLMASRLENRPVSVSSLCIASAVPPTTALRWINLMTERGLLERESDPNDARRVFITLNADTAATTHGLLVAMLSGTASPV